MLCAFSWDGIPYVNCFTVQRAPRTSPVVIASVRRAELDGNWHPWKDRKILNILDLSQFGELHQGSTWGGLPRPYREVEHCHLSGFAQIGQHSLYTAWEKVDTPYRTISTKWKLGDTIPQYRHSSSKINFMVTNLPFGLHTPGMKPGLLYAWDWWHDIPASDSSTWLQACKTEYALHTSDGVQYLDAKLFSDTINRNYRKYGVTGYTGCDGLAIGDLNVMSIRIMSFRGTYDEEHDEINNFQIRYDTYGIIQRRDCLIEGSPTNPVEYSWTQNFHGSTASCISWRGVEYHRKQDTMFSAPVDAIKRFSRNTALGLRSREFVNPRERAFVRGEALVTDPDGYSDINMIENLSGLEPGAYIQAVKTMIQGYEAFMTGDAYTAINALRSTYLWYCYVFCNDTRDLADLRDNQYWKNISRIHQIPPVVQRASKSFHGATRGFTGEFRLTSSYYWRVKENPFAQFLDALDRVGLDPTAENVWAALPWSFVVDWFTKFGDVLRKMDMFTKRAIQLDLIGRGESVKFTASDVNLRGIHPWLTPLGPIQLELYARTFSRDVGEYEYEPTSPSVGYPQILQGACLLRF